MEPISQEAAHRIWLAHREIEVGEQLLAEIEKELDAHKYDKPTDRHYGIGKRIEMGIPAGNGHRLLDVAPHLALAVIRAHIAEKHADLIAATEAAVVETRIRIRSED